MVNGVKVQQQGNGAEYCPPGQKRPTAFFRLQGHPVYEKQYTHQDQCHKIAEEGLLHCGNVAGQPDESRHHGKAEGGKQYAQYTLDAGADLSHLKSIPLQYETGEKSIPRGMLSCVTALPFPEDRRGLLRTFPARKIPALSALRWAGDRTAPDWS